MGNEIGAQLTDFLRAALLGLVAGTVYDLLRSVRLRGRMGRAATHLLDMGYVLSVMFAVFLFALRQGEGELRLYMSLAMLTGFCLYFLTLASLFRPIWLFWADVLARIVKIPWKPAVAAGRAAKKIQIYIKKLFYFWCKCATINK